ncbi:MAG: heme peroxidase [Pseudonocardiales bacterium]|nr:heme peroxidase [Pseudonocardiales bacterium]MBV9652845.1 heme peroxidase [Pseudonocardiales bacterium]
MKRHVQTSYYVEGEGLWTLDEAQQPRCIWPEAAAEVRMFRFSRLGPVGEPTDPALNHELARAMTAAGDEADSSANRQPRIPAGFTYLGQFVDHDLTLDATAVALGQDVTVDELVDNRSPALDLDSVYGRGPGNAQDQRFYAADGIKLKTGTTAAVSLANIPGVPDATNPNPPHSASTNVNRDGFDLPRVGTGATKAAERTALIPDTRNDENLAVAQTHLAFIHFHNRVVDTLATRGVPSLVLFEAARSEVVQHYQWMLRHDHLPRIVDPDIVDDVFTHGRKFFEVSGGPTGTMPIEFSVAAYRLGHSMIRGAYQWNRVFRAGGPLGIATLLQLFAFTGTSGNFAPPTDPAQLDNPNSGTLIRLPTNWIVDWRRLHDFSVIPNFADVVLPDQETNEAKRIDTRLVNPLDHLPAGTFAGREQNLPQDDIQRNLAFRNLTRANMVKLASGQQMADFFGVKQLTPAEILNGNGDGSGANLTAEDSLNQVQQDALVASTPLWFYILREAEINHGKLGQVGGRIVAEVFHRAMEISTYSIVRNPHWRPQFGPDPSTFRMVDLLLFAFNNDLALLNPLGDA